MFFLKLNAQEIEIDSTFTSDQTIYPFNQTEVIYRLSITGNVSLENDRSIVRVIMIDNMSNEHLVFESYTLIDTLNSFSFSNYCEESCYLNAVTPYSLKVEIIEASIYIDNLTLSTTPIENIDSLWQQLKYQQVNNKVNNINLQTSKKGLRWNTVHYSDTLIRLPFYYELQTDQIEYICKKIREFFK